MSTNLIILNQLNCNLLLGNLYHWSVQFILVKTNTLVCTQHFISFNLVIVFVIRGLRRKYVYRKIFSTTNILTTFNCDLIVISPKYITKGNLYCLVCIDTISRYVFHTYMKKRNSFTLIKAFNKILKLVRSYKNQKLVGIPSVDFLTFIR